MAPFLLNNARCRMISKCAMCIFKLFLLGHGMLLWRAMCLVLIEQVAMAPMSPTDSPDPSVVRERYEPGVHMINNANPYQGVTVTKGHGKYPVIFEPLQNVQTSCSTYKVTSSLTSPHT